MDIDAGPAADYRLPDLTLAEAIETTRIHSVDGLAGGRTAFATVRPFRAPHHAICDVVLIGGDQTPMLGEGSLAHHAVLFLDELPEFRRHVLEVLQQPLEDGVVTITRASMFASGQIRRPQRYTSECEADILLGHASSSFAILRGSATPSAGRMA